MSSPGVRAGSARPDDALQLAVGVQPEHTAVAADTAELEAAERRFVVALDRVDADVAAAQLPGHAIAADAVRSPDVVVEAEGGAVGEGHRLVLVVERLDDDDRAEELLLCDAHPVLHTGEQRRCDVV